MGLFSPYQYKAKDGQKWYLHSRDRGKVRFYFFSKDQLYALPGIPRGYELFLNERTGLPMLRKLKKATKK
jgi:hypothetical protein